MNALKIVSRPATFRRAGYAFSTTPTYLKLKDLDADTIKRLKSEQMLIVEEVDHDFGDAAEAKKPAAKPDAPAANALKVTAKKDGYNRAGFKFGVEPIIVPLSEHPAKIKAIRDDAELTVEEVVHDFGDAK
jgi:hypothetical protein